MIICLQNIFHHFIKIYTKYLIYTICYKYTKIHYNYNKIYYKIYFFILNQRCSLFNSEECFIEREKGIKL